MFDVKEESMAWCSGIAPGLLPMKSGSSLNADDPCVAPGHSGQKQNFEC